VRGVKARTAGSRTLSKLVFAWNSRHLACHAFYGRPLKATPLRSGTRQLAHDQHFTNAIAGEKELYGSKVTKQIFDVAIIEDALQLKSVGQGGMDSSGRAAASFAAEFDLLHFESVAANNMEAMTGRVWTGIASVEERQQHTAGFQHRPQPPYHRLHKTLIEVVRQIPAEDDVKLGGGIDQIIGEKLAAVENVVALFVFREKLGIGRSRQQIFAVNFVAALSEVADVGRRRRP